MLWELFKGCESVNILRHRYNDNVTVPNLGSRVEIISQDQICI